MHKLAKVLCSRCGTSKAETLVKCLAALDNPKLKGWNLCPDGREHVWPVKK